MLFVFEHGDSPINFFVFALPRLSREGAETLMNCAPFQKFYNGVRKFGLFWFILKQGRQSHGSLSSKMVASRVSSKIRVSNKLKDLSLGIKFYIC